MYIDLKYIRKRVKESDLIAYSVDEDEPQEVNEDRILACVTDAGSMLDRALKVAGYSAPIASPSDDTKRLVFDIFLYYISGRKYDDEEMKDVYVRYNKAFKFIEAIARKEVVLPDAIRAVTTSAVVVTNKTIEDRVFTRRRLDT